MVIVSGKVKAVLIVGQLYILIWAMEIVYCRIIEFKRCDMYY